MRLRRIDERIVRLRDPMTTSSPVIPGPNQTVGARRWRTFLAVAVVAHGLSLFACPSLAVSHDLATVGLAVFICVVPFCSGLILFLLHRTLLERIIVLCSLLASLFWLVMAGGFIEQALKAR